MKKLYSYSFLLASLFCALAISARAQEVAGASNAWQGQTDIKLKGADGKTYDTASLRGNVLLVSFGATWCEPCREELQALEQLKKEYRDKPVKFIWISIESQDEVSDGALRDYAKKLKISFPVLRDPDKATFSRFSARLRLPTILFYDKSGKLSTPNHVGMAAIPIYLAKMRERLDKLLMMEAATSAKGR
jgi:thiol-disulfide isomerase/thioredoxin